MAIPAGIGSQQILTAALAAPQGFGSIQWNEPPMNALHE
jgi:hypothetical protein